jgi:nucleoside-diphosphate-sugar epimerase
VYKNIFITGSTGFVGTNLISKFSDYNFISYKKNHLIEIKQEVVIHLAGKAHDLKKTTSVSDYYEANSELTKKVFDAFLSSNSKVFIILSSVKAVADTLESDLTEEHTPNPVTHYGKSKLLAEKYILTKNIPNGKRVYILRPCMIHGPGNKGNLNLLYKTVKNGIPWLLGSFENQRSFCSIDNLCFIINELIINENISSGVYNIADDEALSTNMIIELISKSLNRKTIIWKIPKFIIICISKLGDLFKLPLNSERLHKLTESYVVSNSKIKLAIKKSLPLSSKEGMIKTFDSFLHL